MALLVMCSLSVSLSTASPIIVWPVPESITCDRSGSSAALKTGYGFKVTGPGAASAVVAAATTRVKADLGGGSASGTISTIAITVASLSERLDDTTTYNYTISFPKAAGNVVEVTALSPFGVSYALLSLGQLLGPGAAGCSTFDVVDHPHYVHRGIMIDTGRRFYPIPLVESILDGMELFKLNVLHFHLSEECFRVESKVFPELTAGCTSDGRTDVEYVRTTPPLSNRESAREH